MEPVLDRARAIADDLIALRRELHRVPELDRDLPKTQALVLSALEGLDLEITTGTALSSVTAVLRGGAHDGTGPVVLLRGDMDALPVLEETGLPYASEHTGQMHACGHDLHVAGLVGAARLLHEDAGPAGRRRRVHVAAGGGDHGWRDGDDRRGSARGGGATDRRGVLPARDVLRPPARRLVLRARGR